MEGCALQTSLSARDQAVIWHPFTQMQGHEPIAITHAQGNYLIAESGSRYLDAISSWWVNLHGHSHPYLTEKIQQGLEKMQQVIFAGFTHGAAIELAERLVQKLPAGLTRIFYSENGSTAIEVALKMALQYWHNRGKPKRKKVLAFKGGYHGDTFGAMSAAGKNPLNRPFWSHLFDVDLIELPLAGYEERAIEELKAKASDRCACFLFEPLIVGAGGMRIYSKDALEAMLKIVRAHEILIVADEVMTGFGRLGPLFASDLLYEKPDIIALAKGLTGGFLPLAVTACTEEIYRAFLSNELSSALLHGHSYTANALACVSALASLDLLESDSCYKKRELIGRRHSAFIEKLKDHPRLTRAESIGTLAILEYRIDVEGSYFAPLREALYPFFLGEKILLRPLGNVVYIMTPYSILEEELEWIYRVIEKSLEVV